MFFGIWIWKRSESGETQTKPQAPSLGTSQGATPLLLTQSGGQRPQPEFKLANERPRRRKQGLQGSRSPHEQCPAEGGGGGERRRGGRACPHLTSQTQSLPYNESSCSVDHTCSHGSACINRPKLDVVGEPGQNLIDLPLRPDCIHKPNNSCHHLSNKYKYRYRCILAKTSGSA